MARFNTFCRGTPDEVIRELEEEPAEEHELRAALQNAFQRIKRLEAFVETVEKLAAGR
jgi:hypothetical protein